MIKLTNESPKTLNYKSPEIKVVEIFSEQCFAQSFEIDAPDWVEEQDPFI